MDQNLNFGNMTFPVYIQARAAGANCNLNCAYCINGSARDNQSNMNYHVLERFTKQYIDAQIHSDVNFLWQGGEPLLCGIPFYEKALEYQKKFGGQRKISNTIFTNGTLLNNDWCTFLKENNFRINLSLDGPREFHNRYRTTVYGTESFEFVINGLNLLKKFNIKTEYTVGIHDLNVKHPYKMYDFIRKSELTDVTFRPYISHTKAKKESWSIDAYRYGEFLCSIFDMWVRRDIGRIKISIIEDTLKIFCNRTGSLCTFKPTCGHSAVMKSDGNIYTCSNYIQPDHHLGDMFNHTITGLMYSRKQIKFGQSKKNNLTKQCKRCEYLRFCNGGCPKDRVATSNTGEKGHNYLCQAYHSFFEHSFPAMTFIAEEISRGGSPERIMTYFDAFDKQHCENK